MSQPFAKRLLRLALPLLAVLALAALALARLHSLGGRDGYAGRTVLLNEICPKNLTGLTDGEGNAAPWLELCNVSGEAVDLAGYSLSLDEELPRQWVFPDDVVLDGGANNLLVLFLDGKDCYDAAGSLHTGLLPDGGKDTLTLYAPDGAVVDRLTLPDVPYDMTYGRCLNDGSRAGILAAATPGSPNPADFWQEETPAASLGEVQFSLQGGFYEEEQRLILTASDPDALILYTLDGSEPDLGADFYTAPLTLASRVGEANRYAAEPAIPHGDWLMNYAYRYAPNEVDKATTVTARLYKDGVLGEAVTARTYWIGVELHTLPVVSLTADPAELFGAEGIYTAGTSYFTLRKYGLLGRTGNYDADRTIAGRISVTAADGALLLEDGVKIHLSGGWSRQDALLKNLHIKLDSGRTGLLEAETGDTLRAFVLRGSGNGASYLSLHQDAFLNDYLYDQGLGAQYNLPVALYLEDEYWGVYTVRESKNEDFFRRHFGVEPENLICPGTSDHPANQEEKIAFGLGVDGLDASTDEGLAWAEANVDLDGYIRYVIAQMYTYNADGLYNGGNNTILWKDAGAGSDGRWHFLLNDLDATLIDAEVDPFRKLLTEDYSFAARETAPWYSVACNLFQKLWQSEAFRARFAQVYRREMATTYAPENLLAAFGPWCDALRPELARDLARQEVEVTALAPLAEALTGQSAAPLRYSAGEWEDNVNRVEDYFARRADVMLDYLDRYLAAEGGLPDA